MQLMSGNAQSCRPPQAWAICKPRTCCAQVKPPGGCVSAAVAGGGDAVAATGAGGGKAAAAVVPGMGGGDAAATVATGGGNAPAAGGVVAVPAHHAWHSEQSGALCTVLPDVHICDNLAYRRWREPGSGYLACGHALTLLVCVSLSMLRQQTLHADYPATWALPAAC